jgi:hypothetical protein
MYKLDVAQLGEGNIMGRGTRLRDDFDGQELPAGTEPVRLSLGETTYRIHLSEENRDKLLEALAPFTARAKVEDPERRMSNMRLISQPKG